MRYVIFLAALTLMAGCKTPPNPGDITNAPPERVYGFTRKSDAQLVVLRTSLDNGCAIRLSIDGTPAADIIAGEIAHFGVTIGAHSLSARSTEGCANHWTRKVRVGVKAGDALIIYIDKADHDQVSL
ncbi:hypothetical protein RCO22_23620 [Pseudomonas yamanorum]|uniref:Lipoprotein n=1 Tax=Pseudomonas yamanorum TaxID=515393 RepID=A0ABU1CXC6_9PSED|nr:hypothetical protein [Pseudomonas yamanorum]MDR0191939.1 hypothetical protein [Pseudomonas yamanorum]